MNRISSIAVAAGVALAAIGLTTPTATAQQPGRYDHYDVHDKDLPTREEYASRRRRVLEKLDEHSALLVHSAEAHNRNGDVDYQYRQSDGLIYLTGLPEEKGALLLAPGGIMIDGKKATEVLFVAERNPKSETWTGITMGPATAAKVLGIETVVSFDRLREVQEKFLPTVSTLYADDMPRERRGMATKGAQLLGDAGYRNPYIRMAPDLTTRNAGEILDEMRLIKSPTEIALLKRAVEISMDGHRATIQQGKPGMYEYELAAIMEYNFHRQGSEYVGYPSIVGSGPNSCILHYESNRRQTQPGDVVLMDCGAEYHGYSADVTRTFPISGRFSAEQRAIYDLVLAAQDAGIASCTPGNTFFDAHRSATEIISAGLIKLGIIRSSQEVSRYFMHGTSHYIGLDVHDVGSMGELKPGMVMTVEPGVYIASGSPCDPKWWNIGIRIEDDILITEEGPVNLSEGLARRAEDIESLVAGSTR